MERTEDLRALSGRVALVAGGSSGIGKAISAALSAAGAMVAINSRNPERVADAVRGIPGSVPAPFDITDGQAIERGLDRMVSELGRLDIVVCSAALRDRRRHEDIDADSYRSLLETNLVAPFQLGRIAARHIGSGGSGRLIYISALGAQRPFQGDSAYASSKAGVESLVRSLAYELGPRGITTNGISPGFIQTEFNAGWTNDASFSEMVKRRVPLGRWGRPEDIANTAVFLASDAACYINGHIITVDGGLMAAL